MYVNSDSFISKAVMAIKFLFVYNVWYFNTPVSCIYLQNFTMQRLFWTIPVANMRALFAVDKRPFQVQQIKNPAQQQEKTKKTQ